MIADEIKMAERFQDKPFAIIGINSDKEDRAVLKKMLLKNSITWKNVLEGSTEGSIAEKWNVRSWPTTYILDSEGVIRYKNLRGKELRKAIENLFYEMEY